MSKETIGVTKDEVKRLRILAKVQEGSLTMREAAAVAGVTVRQLRRLRRRVESEGDKGVMHHNRGRTPAHAIPEATRTRIVELYQGTYRGANASHFSQLLAEHEAVIISPSTALRILKEAGALPKVLKRRPKRHAPRLRRPKEGMLWQLDASAYRPAPHPVALARVLAFTESRSLSPAGTVSFEGQIYAITAPGLALPKRSMRVFVIRTLRGKLFVSLGGTCFPIQPTTPEPKEILPPKVPEPPHAPPVPARGSPWRQAMRHDYLRHQAELANPNRKRDAVMAAYDATRPLSRPH